MHLKLHSSFKEAAQILKSMYLRKKMQETKKYCLYRTQIYKFFCFQFIAAQKRE